MRTPNVIYQDFSKRVVQGKKVKLVTVEASSAIVEFGASGFKI